MKRYFNFGIRRTAKFLPLVLAVTLALLIGLAAALWGILSTNSQKDENKIYRIGVVGETQNEFFDFGVKTFNDIDQTRFSLEFLPMNEETAKKEMTNGKISAYLIFPDNFIENALLGDVRPMEFVATTKANSIATLIEKELVSSIATLVISSQQGSYGMYDAVYAQNGHNHSLAQTHLNTISLQYFELVLRRTDLINVTELGLSGGLNYTHYYICSIILVFIALLGLPFAALYCHRDNSLAVLLKSKGVSAAAQQFCDLTVHFLALLLLTAAVTAASFLLLKFTDISADADMFIAFYVKLLPILIMFAAFNLLIFQITSNIISGLLLHFFVSVSLCYISGCFYPIQSFPVAVQLVAEKLPIYFAREQLSTVFTGGSSLLTTSFLLGAAVLFFVAATVIKQVKITRNIGG